MLSTVLVNTLEFYMKCVAIVSRESAACMFHAKIIFAFVLALIYYLLGLSDFHFTRDGKSWSIYFSCFFTTSSEVYFIGR